MERYEMAAHMFAAGAVNPSEMSWRAGGASREGVVEIIRTFYYLGFILEASAPPALAQPVGRTLGLTHQMLTSCRRGSFDCRCHGESPAEALGPAGVTHEQVPVTAGGGHRATQLESSPASVCKRGPEACRFALKHVVLS